MVCWVSPHPTGVDPCHGDRDLNPPGRGQQGCIFLLGPRTRSLGEASLDVVGRAQHRTEARVEWLAEKFNMRSVSLYIAVTASKTLQNRMTICTRLHSSVAHLLLIH